MDRWQGRVAVVTGASAGIGAAIVYQLQDAGLDVVALARRKEKIATAVETARKDAESRGREQNYKAAKPGKLHSLQCDVSKEEDVLAAFKWIKDNTNGVDILINNAGLVGGASLTDPGTPVADLKKVLDINVFGLSLCTREAVQQMKIRGVDDGHIIHISSIAGHINPGARYQMYFASKHAMRVLTEGLRKELVAAKSKIRVTEVSPGLVKTDIVNEAPGVNVEEFWKQPHMLPEDIAEVVLYAISVPPHVQIHELMVMPVGEVLNQ